MEEDGEIRVVDGITGDAMVPVDGIRIAERLFEMVSVTDMTPDSMMDSAKAENTIIDQEDLRKTAVPTVAAANQNDNKPPAWSAGGSALFYLEKLWLRCGTCFSFCDCVKDKRSLETECPFS